jgi:uncharacterized membrane protein YkvA (DUF1232 family)
MSYLSSIKAFISKTGISLTYSALLLYYAYKRSDTPSWAKRIIAGSLGYLIAPLDALPDITPILGFTDDLGVLSYGLVTLAAYVNTDVRVKARKKLTSWLGKIDLERLRAVDDKI